MGRKESNQTNLWPCHSGHVYGCQKPSTCQGSVQQVRSLSLWSSGICSQPLAFHTCAGSSVAPVLYWCAMGASVCWRSCCNGRLTWRMHCKVEGMERGYGTQGTERQHEEDNVHGLGMGAWPSLQSVGVVLVRTLFSARSAFIGCTRSAVVLEEDWLRIQTMFVQGAVIRLDRLTIDLSHR